MDDEKFGATVTLRFPALTQEQDWELWLCVQENIQREAVARDQLWELVRLQMTLNRPASFWRHKYFKMRTAIRQMEYLGTFDKALFKREFGYKFKFDHIYFAL